MLIHKLTNEIVDKRLENRNIKRLDDYVNNKTKIKFLCLVDGYVWSTVPGSIFSGMGCPKCAGTVRVTNEIVDARISGRNIKRLGTVVTNRDKIVWVCLIDGYVWENSPDNVVRGSGCPKCYGKLPLNNDIIDSRLNNRNIKRVSEFINMRTKLKWECVIDGHVWEAVPDSVVNLGTGCPLCNYKGEKNIYTFLSDNFGIEELTRQKKLKINKNNYFVDFEFKGIFIEYNGEQHYRPVEFFGGESQFKKQQKRDEELRQYCLENNIPLIEVKYDQPDKLNWLKNEIDSILNKEEKAA